VVRKQFEDEARNLDDVAQKSEDLRVTLESAAADAAILKIAAQMSEASDGAESELKKADGHARTFDTELKSEKARTPEQRAQSQTLLASLAGSGASATKLAHQKLEFDFLGRDGSAALARAGEGAKSKYNAAARKLEELRGRTKESEAKVAGASRVVDEQKYEARAKTIQSVATTAGTIANTMKTGYAEAAQLAKDAQKTAETTRNEQIKRMTEAVRTKGEEGVSSVVEAETTKARALSESVVRAREGVEAEYAALVASLDEAKDAVARAEQTCAEHTGARDESAAARALIEVKSLVQSAETTAQRAAKSRASFSAAVSAATTSLRALERIAAQRQATPETRGANESAVASARQMAALVPQLEQREAEVRAALRRAQPALGAFAAYVRAVPAVLAEIAKAGALEDEIAKHHAGATERRDALVAALEGASNRLGEAEAACKAVLVDAAAAPAEAQQVLLAATAAAQHAASAAEAAVKFRQDASVVASATRALRALEKLAAPTQAATQAATETKASHERAAKLVAELGAHADHVARHEFVVRERMRGAKPALDACAAYVPNVAALRSAQATLAELASRASRATHDHASHAHAIRQSADATKGATARAQQAPANEAAMHAREAASLAQQTRRAFDALCATTAGASELARAAEKAARTIARFAPTSDASAASAAGAASEIQRLAGRLKADEEQVSAVVQEAVWFAKEAERAAAQHTPGIFSKLSGMLGAVASSLASSASSATAPVAPVWASAPAAAPLLASAPAAAPLLASAAPAAAPLLAAAPVAPVWASAQHVPVPARAAPLPAPLPLGPLGPAGAPPGLLGAPGPWGGSSAPREREGDEGDDAAGPAGPAGEPIVDRDALLAVPGVGKLEFSADGYTSIERKGKLLSYQKLGLDVITDSKTRPGTRPIRSSLVFFSMGAGKTALVHAVLNYIVGIAKGLIDSAPASSLACRVALLWQSREDAERQRSFLKKNMYGVFGGVAATADASAVHDSIFFGSIDAKADLDELKEQLQLPTKSWLKRFQDANAKGKSDETNAAKEGLQITDAENKVKRAVAAFEALRDGDTTPGVVPYGWTSVTQANREVEKAKAALKTLREEQKTNAKNAEANAERRQKVTGTWKCTPRSRLLFVVDECHKLFAEGNPNYGLIRACVACDHATAVLMSGTPVTSNAPEREFVRMCMLLGGRKWTLEALNVLAGTEPHRHEVAEKVFASVAKLGYATLGAVMQTTLAKDEFTAKKYTALVTESDGAIAIVDAALQAAEVELTGFVERDVRRAETLLALRLKGRRLVHVSYYGRINGNTHDHERYRDDFVSYDFSTVLRVLRDAHVAAVSGKTQRDAANDRHFELVRGEYYSRTIDPDAYRVSAEGVVARVSAHIEPSRLQPKAVWHSAREFAPTFLPNRVVRCLHVCVPSLVARPMEPGTDVLPDERDGLVHEHTLAWLRENVRPTPAWHGAEYERKLMQLKQPSHWNWYHFVWSLGVVYATACASAFGHGGGAPGAEAHERNSVVVYLDRQTYGLTRRQMELAVHAVFHESMAHPLHEKLGRGGVPYKAATSQKGKLVYQIGWDGDTIDEHAKTMAEWVVSGTADVHVGDVGAEDDVPAFNPTAAAAAFGAERAERAERAATAASKRKELIESFGALFALDLEAAYGAVQGKTTRFDDAFRGDVTKANRSATFGKVHVLFMDMFTDEAGGMSLNTEGVDLGSYGGLCVVGIPEGMSAQRMAQLFDRINRVDLSITPATKRRKFVVLITRPNALVEPKAPLQTMGNDARDRTVDALNAALARHAYDCDAHREPHERAFACATRRA
jgi:hypothetical protein